jgi:signal transduction histidine kinase
MSYQHKEFWDDAIEKNIYYSYYVLPASIIIHILAYFGIDLFVVGKEYIEALIMRLLPIVYLSILIYLIKYNIEKIRSYLLELFFFAGVVSSIPIINHAGFDLYINGSLYSGGMGIFILKVIMTMFVFLRPSIMYSFYLLIDIISLIGFLNFARVNFINNLQDFLVFTLLSDVVLIVSYNVYLDNRRKLFYNKQKLEAELLFKEKYFSFLAHDIKSPVSLLKSVVDVLKNEEIDLKRQSHYINHLERQLDSLDNLVVNILSWIKSSDSQVKLNFQELNLLNLIQKNLELLDKVIIEKELTINMQVESNANIKYDINSFEIILNNLLRNALKFAEEKSVIEIRFVNDSILEITNFGLEIDDQQIENFNNSLSVYPKNGVNGEKGHGLGLEIVKNLTSLNNSTFTLDKDGRKTIVRVEFH